MRKNIFKLVGLTYKCVLFNLQNIHSCFKCYTTVKVDNSTTYDKAVV